MKIFLFVILLCFVSPICGQTVTYDKFKDQTTVEIDVKVKDGSNPPNKLNNLRLQLSYSYAGTELKKSPDHYFAWFSQSNLEWRFLRSHSLIVLADGSRINFGDGRYSGNVRNRGVYEAILYWMAPGRMQTIANAKSLELQLGPYEGMIDADGIKKISDFYNQSLK